LQLWHPCMLQYGSKLVFVEPDTRFHLNLQQRLKNMDVKYSAHLPRHTEPKMEIVNGALCLQDADNVSFYTFSSKLRETFTQLESNFSGLSSLSWNTLVNNHRRHFFSSDYNPGYTKPEWESMLEFVEEVHVRCFSPQSLLWHIGVEPHHVLGVIIDAKGYNVELTKRFFAAGVAPHILQFEWDAPANIRNFTGTKRDRANIENFVEHNVSSMVQYLGKQGYEVKVHDQDMLAINAGMTPFPVTPEEGEDESSQQCRSFCFENCRSQQAPDDQRDTSAEAEVVAAFEVISPSPPRQHDSSQSQTKPTKLESADQALEEQQQHAASEVVEDTASGDVVADASNGEGEGVTRHEGEGHVSDLLCTDPEHCSASVGS